ncbi:MAG: GTPase HflX [Myxococcales bacterium]|nr:GTPase HflX [Myxococcales bacterium]
MLDLSKEDLPAHAILAAVELPDTNEEEVQHSLDELARLAKTLGLVVGKRFVQKRQHIDPKAVFGQGKVQELADEVERLTTSEPEREVVVLLDLDVSPSQIRQLSQAVKADVYDRTGVILDIFHRHAKSRQAKTQVEIVRLTYLTPRMRELGKRKGERQGGGIGGKGKGESHMELDRRKVRDRIAELRLELLRIEEERSVQRARRQQLRRVALVGYTNAGKSTLMRALTGSDVYVADKLFATLDTTVRNLHPPVDPPIVVSDTVGFIRKLPHDLVASFKSTLDEALEASLLLQIVDAADPAFPKHVETTEAVLTEIGAETIPMQLVFNKWDQVTDLAVAERLCQTYPNAWRISAKNERDVARVREGIIGFFEGQKLETTVLIPHSKGNLRAQLYANAEVLAESYDEEGGHYRVRITPEMLARITAELP